MVDGEKIVYVHKKTGIALSNTYLKQLLNTCGEYDISKKIMLKLYEFSQEYFIVEIPFSEDFEPMVLHEHVTPNQYDKVISYVKLFDRSTLDLYLLSTLQNKIKELVEYEYKFGNKLEDIYE